MKIVLLLFIVSFSVFANDMKFKSVQKDSFILYGLPKHIAYKTKKERNEKIFKLWQKFLNSNRVDLKNSSDKKIYMTYFNYKANAFDVFIGIKSNKKLIRLSQKKIPKSKYYHTKIVYKKDMNIDNLWEEINKKKLRRNFKMDMEIYRIEQLAHEQQLIDIYLSK